MALQVFSLRRPMPVARAIGRATALFGTAFSSVFGTALAGTATYFGLTALGLGGPLALLPAVVASLAATVGSFRVGDRLLRWSKTWSAPMGDLVVGADGVRWDSHFRRRFLAWSRIRGASAREGTLVIEHDGGTVRIRTTSAEPVARTVREAVAAHAAREKIDVPTALAPDRDAARWIERQRGLARADYRADGAGDAATLVRVALDPTAAPIARVGATLALGKDATAERARVRVAVEDVADEETQAALEAALDDRVSVRQVRALGSR